MAIAIWRSFSPSLRFQDEICNLTILSLFFTEIRRRPIQISQNTVQFWPAASFPRISMVRFDQTYRTPIFNRRVFREMRRSRARPDCRADVAILPTKGPLEFVIEGISSTYNGMNGKFFDCAQNDMSANQHSQNQSVTRTPKTVMLRKPPS